MFSLYNKDTINSLHRLSHLWRIPVVLQTMDSSGKSLTLTSDGEKFFVSKNGKGPKFDD